MPNPRLMLKSMLRNLDELDWLYNRLQKGDPDMHTVAAVPITDEAQPDVLIDEKGVIWEYCANNFYKVGELNRGGAQ